MVSLVELSEVTEEGVKFRSPYDGKEILLTPEQSISIQNSLGTNSFNTELLKCFSGSVYWLIGALVGFHSLCGLVCEWHGLVLNFTVLHFL